MCFINCPKSFIIIFQNSLSSHGPSLRDLILNSKDTRSRCLKLELCTCSPIVVHKDKNVDNAFYSISLQAW